MLFLEAIYASDKAGELSCFTDGKYIQLLEQKNENLESQKYNYTGSLNRIPYWLAAYLGSLGTVQYLNNQKSPGCLRDFFIA